MTEAPKFDPYEILGVTRDADDAAIKAAYRRAAMKHHPDHTGGDDTRFKDINRAHKILKDAARRAAFDATGDVDEPEVDPKQQEALGLIYQLLGKIMTAEVDPLRTDLIKAMTMLFDQKIAEIREKTRPIELAMSRARRLRGRFKPKKRRRRKGEPQDPPENYLGSMVDRHIQQLEKIIEKNERDLSVHRLAIAIIKDHNFSPETSVGSMSFAARVVTPYRFTTGTGSGA